MSAQTIHQYKQFLRDTSWYKHAHHDNSGEIAYLALGLAGETGEFVDQVKKIVRESGFDNYFAFQRIMNEPGGRERLIEELGDVLWYMTRIMDVLKIDIQDLMVLNTYKLYTRLLELEKIDPKETPWPFTDPFISYENVKEQLDVHIDEEV
jgi:NTP pyrophosphatase (non-canonical NTP hydrolase)